MNGEVKRYDSPLRYLVPSDTLNIEYLVDLGAYSGNGQCVCKGFICHYEPKLMAGAVSCDALRCRHIKRAREKLTNEIVERMSAIEKQNESRSKAATKRVRRTA